VRVRFWIKISFPLDERQKRRSSESVRLGRRAAFLPPGGVCGCLPGGHVTSLGPAEPLSGTGTSASGGLRSPCCAGSLGDSLCRPALPNAAHAPVVDGPQLISRAQSTPLLLHCNVSRDSRERRRIFGFCRTVRHFGDISQEHRRSMGHGGVLTPRIRAIGQCVFEMSRTARAPIPCFATLHSDSATPPRGGRISMTMPPSGTAMVARGTSSFSERCSVEIVAEDLSSRALVDRVGDLGRVRCSSVELFGVRRGSGVPSRVRGPGWWSAP